MKITMSNGVEVNITNKDLEKRIVGLVTGFSEPVRQPVITTTKRAYTGRYTPEDDLFIVEGLMTKKSYKWLARNLKREPSSLYNRTWFLRQDLNNLAKLRMEVAAKHDYKGLDYTYVCDNKPLVMKLFTQFRRGEISVNELAGEMLSEKQWTKQEADNFIVANHVPGLDPLLEHHDQAVNNL